MTKRVIWSAAALRDYENLIDFVAERDGVEQAQRLHRKVHPAVQSLSDSPERCRVVPELKAIGVTVYRELIVRPYRVPFRIQGRDVVVLAIVDGRRDLEELLIERLVER
ncbi:MAG: type II toxin-antitoxin system RelE/ParE family toxin [Sandaracinaceae bacterium]|nr:type II toxin-antitoxin system RelE/ParE family toxin [Sandaracinaceae bacterium]